MNNSIQVRRVSFVQRGIVTLSATLMTASQYFSLLRAWYNIPHIIRSVLNIFWIINDLWLYMCVYSLLWGENFHFSWNFSDGLEVWVCSSKPVWAWKSSIFTRFRSRSRRRVSSQQAFHESFFSNHGRTLKNKFVVHSSRQAIVREHPRTGCIDWKQIRWGFSNYHKGE